MTSTVVKMAVEEGMDTPLVAGRERLGENIIRALRQPQRGPSARERILAAWLCTPQMREQYHQSAEFHAAVVLLSTLAEVAVFEDLPISDTEREDRRKALEVLTTLLGSDA